MGVGIVTRRDVPRSVKLLTVRNQRVLELQGAARPMHVGPVEEKNSILVDR